MTPVTVQRSRTIAVPVADAFDRTLPIDLTDLFSHWFGPIPPIRQVRDQGGRWGVVGQTRTVLLTGGGSMHEELTAVDGPGSFAYRLTDVTGALGPIVDHVDGYWRFDATDAAHTMVTWGWALHPRSAIARPVVELIGRLWTGYADRALRELEKQITTAS